MFDVKIDEEVYVRQLDQQMAKPLFTLIDGQRPYLREWLPWVDATKTWEDSLAYIESAEQQAAAGNGFHAGVFYKGEIAGCIGIHGIDNSNRKTSIGYWLGRDFQGRGIMTRSCRAVTNYVFRSLDMNRVEIRAGEGNRRSRAIPERLGFVLEGKIRQSEWLYDHFIDHMVYGMLAEDWIEN